MLIDSIMGTIDHIYCDNTFHVITEQNHRRNTIVGRPGTNREGTSRCPGTKKNSCPGVPLSRDKGRSKSQIREQMSGPEIS
jgi:hypothetical protein